MKLNCWLIFGVMLSTSLLAQQDTNPPAAPPIETPAAAPAITEPAAPAATNAPAAKTAKTAKKKAVAKKKAKKSPQKKVAKRPARKSEAAELRSVPLVPGPATVVATHVNVRGQAKLKSEVVTRLSKGQQVTVLQEIVHNNSGPTEPSAWAKILLPENAHAWVFSAYLTNNSARTRLKIRSGPGENYSMLGILHSGQEVKSVSTKGDWTQIEPPTNAYAFVAAQYLTQSASEAIAATPTAPETTEPAPAPAPLQTNVVASTELAAAPTNAPVPPPAPENLTPAPTNETPALASLTETNAPEVDTNAPPPPRIVSHEGVVRGMTSIQAPTHFELYSPETGQTIDYLFTSSTNLDLRRWKGLRVVVTGEEGLDERWGNTPVLSLQRIQLVDEQP